MFELRVSEIFARVEDTFAWAPAWLPRLLLLAVVVLVAALAHRWTLRILTRLARRRHGFAERLIARIDAPSLLAVQLLVLTPVVPAAGLSYDTTEALVRLLLVGFILVLGWGAIVAVRLAADLYVSRLPTGLDDDMALRAHLTQVRVLGRAADVLILVVTVATALMTMPAVRQFGVSLFASAGAAGLVVGLAARPLLANLIAGIQIALTQPIRLEDAVIVDGEYGWVEEIAATYVVLRLWDLRRMIVPLAHFIEKPFQNWTHGSPSLIGNVMLYVDWSVPVDRVRQKLDEVVHASERWDGRTVGVQVTDVTQFGLVQLRILVSARNASRAWDLRCEVREKLVAFLQSEYPHALPALRLGEVGASRPLVHGGPVN